MNMDTPSALRPFRRPSARRLGAALALGVAAILGGCAPEATRDIPKTTSRPVVQPIPRSQPSAEERICRTRLAELGADFVPLPDLAAGSCSSTNAVTLYHLASDNTRVTVTNLPRISCSLSQDLSNWTRFGVSRAAQQILGSPVVKLETFGSYNCRNVAGSSRRSAHSTASAVDISGFVLADGRRITVESGWQGSSAERQFLRTIHDSACKRFGTVLGPDYNRAHEDHLHLELDGGGYCR
ncbi:extensin family protein [Croceicoccus sp. Ery15]|uniref:extensin-like domain-containing protein n=1 Tax=Croceicoccus sp. Ery15 TaxID=1703338 RepID=UPI001E3D4A27|nr:extensin family protein [Croceicoccus sp. Ery15]